MLTTVPITVTLLKPSGDPVKNSRVTASLTNMDTDAATGMVFPSLVETETDSDGLAVLLLWPNVNGVTGSQYTFRAWDKTSGRKILDEVATVPDHAANLRDILLLPAPSRKPYDEASITAIQQARAGAVIAATQAENFSDQAESALRGAKDYSISANQAADLAVGAKEASETQAQSSEQSASQANQSAQNAQQALGAINNTAQQIEDLTSTTEQAASAAEISNQQSQQAAASSLQSAQEAETSAQRVEGFDEVAGLKAAEARLSAQSAQQSKSLASQYEQKAGTSRNLARDYRDQSQEARNKARTYRESARLWAQQKEDVPVSYEDGEEPQFSAMHWALKALSYLSGGTIVDEGDPSPSDLWSSFKTNQVIQEEKERAELIEGLLQQAIEDETSRAESKELLLEQAIQAEEIARANADDTLQDNIEDETSRAESKELLLEQAIQALEGNTDATYYKKSGGLVSGDMTVTGNFSVQGESVQVDSQISTADRLIILNDGEVGNGITGEFSGIEVDRGTEDYYYFGYSETIGAMVLGKLNSLQPAATRELTPKDNQLASWSAQQKRFITRKAKWSDVDEADNTLQAEKIKQSTARQFLTTSEKNKLSDIAEGATKNATNSFLLNRKNHSGQDQISDVEGLRGELDSKFDKASIKHTTGNSKTFGMSQFGITKVLEAVTAKQSDIGKQGEMGFGVGLYPNPMELYVTHGLSPMPGNDDKNSPNYGNYIHTNGSIMVFVPKHYIRSGSPSSPRYAEYGANALDVASIYDFETTDDAVAAGYRLPRAFIDGGEEKHGFFFDKYDLSRHGQEAKSVPFGKTISLTTSGSYTNSVGIPNCVGQLKDSIPLAKQRGAEFTDISAFMSGALFMLSVAHGQAATNAAACAWYDPAGTTNFPKGCNNNALADESDSSVTYVTAGDSGNSAKPLAGSASNLAKTTHNGQASGIADLNGSIRNTNLGVTVAGSTASSTAQNTSGNYLWVLKPTVKLADLTNGWGSGNDAWGDETHLNTLYDKITAPFDFTSTQDSWIAWGNGANAVFSDSPLDGVLPKNDAAASSGGTNLLGTDGVYRYNRHNMYLLSAGSWSRSFRAGLGYRNLYSSRANSDVSVGARSSAYAK